MIMMRTYAVELFFDEQTEEQLLSIWRGLAEADINASMINIAECRPHITLGVFAGEIDVEVMKQRLTQFAAGRVAFDVSMEGVGTFPTSGTVFISPTVTETLIQLHKEFHASFALFEEHKNPYYLPGRWIPHCTMGIRLSAEEAGRVIEYCYRNFGSGFHGSIAKINLVEILRAPDMTISTPKLLSIQLENHKK